MKLSLQKDSWVFQPHLQATKHTQWQIKVMQSTGILYGHANKIELIWFSFSDVEKEKSSLGYSFNLGLEVLSWPSKKQ